MILNELSVHGNIKEREEIRGIDDRRIDNRIYNS